MQRPPIRLILLSLGLALASASGASDLPQAGAGDCDCRQSWASLVWQQRERNCWQQCKAVCPVWVDAPPLSHARRIELRLLHDLFGQQDAISAITNAYRTKSPDLPLSFHFVGDNGVGKTLAAKLISQSVFQLETEVEGVRSGLVYLRGSDFALPHALPFDHPQIDALRRQIRDRINNKLWYCPSAEVVVDEVELFHPALLAAFDGLLDATVSTAKTINTDKLASGMSQVDASKATIVFISDFGQEKFTRGMGRDQVLHFVHLEAAHRWAGTKLEGLIQHVVAFMPAEPEAIKAQVRSLVRGVGTHPSVAQWGASIARLSFASPTTEEEIASRIVARSGLAMYEAKNYRGVKQIFDQAIAAPILQALDHYLTELPPPTSTVKPAVNPREVEVTLGVAPPNPGETAAQLLRLLVHIRPLQTAKPHSKDEL